MEFRDLIMERNSVRSYSEAPISHEEIVAVLTEAQRAPSWKNQQTSRCYVVESPAKLAEFRERALPSFNQKNSANAVLLVSTYVKNVVGFNDGTAMNEVGNGWGAYDLGLHDAFLILAAKNAGLDTLIMGIRDGEAIREMLEIPEEEEILSVIALGRRADTFTPANRPRKEFSEVVRFI